MFGHLVGFLYLSFTIFTTTGTSWRARLDVFEQPWNAQAERRRCVLDCLQVGMMVSHHVMFVAMKLAIETLTLTPTTNLFYRHCGTGWQHSAH